jgi:light-regulated signal transduction histidine kinase (bacteriophytochrome)
VKLVKEEGRVKGFHCIVRDITERKNFEEQICNHAALLERSNKELEMFAYIASHDLKEPLRKITTFASRVQALPEMKGLSEKGKDYMKRMNDAAKRMEFMIEDLLAYSRIGRNKAEFTDCDLNEIVAKASVDLEEDISRLNAKVDYKDLPVIKGISDQLINLFKNVLSNSVKFAKKGEALYIGVTADIIGRDKVPCRNVNSNSDYIRICVRDNGIGFESKYKKKIFEIFQRLHGRTEYKGTGIGLAIVKKIAERHGGCVDADGVPDKGACIYVYLPLVQDAEAPLAEAC